MEQTVNSEGWSPAESLMKTYWREAHRDELESNEEKK